MRKKTLTLLVLLLSLSFTGRASHYMGGEITWRCLLDGRYVFSLRVYQECAGITFSPSSMALQTNIPGIPDITVYFIDTNDISPVCFPGFPPAFTHIDCELTTIPNQGGVREWIYESDTIQLPASVPPATGWVFSFDGCCRNPCSNIAGTSSMYWFLRAVMYPYNNKPAHPCYDNSPLFAEEPVSVMTTGYHLFYNHNGFDPDGDSLAFSWAEPLTALATPIVPSAYNAGYSWNSPLPGVMHHPSNDPANMDPYTGQISFTSFTTGAFLTSTRCRAYKSGILVSEVFREIQIVLLAGSTNHPPSVTPPFPGNFPSQWSDTVYPGSTVTFPVSAFDYELLNDSLTPQTVYLTASGAQFGTGFTSTTGGCLEPPCATLTPPPTIWGISAVNTVFTWQPTCDHLTYGYGNFDEYVDYQFVITYTDDYCPVPGRVTRTIRIIMKDPVLPPPLLDSFSIHPLTGHVTLHWTPVTDTLYAFDSYHIFFKDQPGGSYSVVDSVYNINQSSFTYTGINANTQPFWCMLKCRSGCPGRLKFSAPSNVLSNVATGTEYTGYDGRILQYYFDQDQQHFVVIANAAKEGLCKFQFFNSMGVECAFHEEYLKQGMNRLVLPLNLRSKGLVLFRLTGNDFQEYGKFIYLK
ncbi:MAG TPA: fibronectin type III domain-containing protein [Bacteroidales bacterium]|nr:fibronectin type III domain-containing protein [Bacteroidales bacterium]